MSGCYIYAPAFIIIIISSYRSLLLTYCVAPTASEVAPTASEVAPTASEVAPTTSDVAPTASDVAPTTSDVLLPLYTSEVAPSCHYMTRSILLSRLTLIHVDETDSFQWFRK